MLNHFAALFTESGNVLKNAPNEYGDLSMMEKAKMVKLHTTTVSGIKGKINSIKGECETIANELNALKEAVQVL